jgi:rfaE bifunctional protein kinase chain/domain
VTTAEILAAFPRFRALVAGDVCLDRWCRYDPELAEESRETGIPRVAVVGGEVTPGAAGTVGNNLAALNAGGVDVLGVVGDDGHGYELGRALAARGISDRLLVKSIDVPTFTYTKLINCRTGEEDLHRVDYIYTRPLPASIEKELVTRFERIAADFDVILISDQAETSQGGVVTPALREAITRAAAARPDTVIWVDSRIRSEHFRGVIVKPNQQEAETASRRALGRVDYAAFRQHLAAPVLVVTHGGEGALVVDPAGSQWVRTRTVEKPVDFCGAGDSFSAGAALALKATGDAGAAARFGNLIASITIMKKGTGTASPGEVLAAER